jgi:cytochrome P450
LKKIRGENVLSKDARARLSGFDLGDPGFLADPYETVARAHREAPVFYDDATGSWVITKYQDIATVLQDWETFSSRAIGRVPPPPDLRERAPDFAAEEIIVALDPPEHTLARQTIQRGFSKKIVDALADTANHVADRVIDGIIGRGECNLIDDFCYPFSLGVIMQMLKLPVEHAADYRRWAQALLALMEPKVLDDGGTETKTLLPENVIRARWSELVEADWFLRGIAAEREKFPQDDLISAMLHARDNEENAIDRGAVVRHSMSLIFAGFDTTANLLAHMVFLFTKNPDQLSALKEDPSLVNNAVEEGLRRRSSGTFIYRVTTKDVELRRQSISRGSLICVLLPGANLDAEMFPDPEKFDIKRSNANKHLGLGRGRHACVGQPLVRLEAPVALLKLYGRMPDLHVDLSIPVEYPVSFPSSTVSRIITRWTPPAGSGSEGQTAASQSRSSPPLITCPHAGRLAEPPRN